MWPELEEGTEPWSRSPVEATPARTAALQYGDFIGLGEGAPAVYAFVLAPPENGRVLCIPQNYGVYSIPVDRIIYDQFDVVVE